MKYITEPQLEKLVESEWVKCHMKDLKVGDKFRMWVYPRKHMKWVPHEDKFGNTEWTAISEPYMHWTINVAEVE